MQGLCCKLQAPNVIDPSRYQIERLPGRNTVDKITKKDGIVLEIILLIKFILSIAICGS
jgi:hypothetical protein